MVTTMELARQTIQKALHSNPVSLRALAKRVGLGGHAALSRFLAGRGRLSLETIDGLCRELGIEGRMKERVMRDLLPPGILNATERTAARGRVPLMKFFFDERIPVIYETLKLFGEADVATLRRSLHRSTRCTEVTIEACLEGLRRLGLVELRGELWRLVPPVRDVVVPSKYSNEVGKRIVRHSLQTCREFVGQPVETRVMRSIVTSVASDGVKGWQAPFRELLLRLQDDALSLQGEEDDVVVQLFVSAVEVARRRPS